MCRYNGSTRCKSNGDKGLDKNSNRYYKSKYHINKPKNPMLSVPPNAAGLAMVAIVSEILWSFVMQRIGENMGEFLAFCFIGYIVYLFMFPNTNSTSYRLGRGMGNKTRQLGEWIMKD